MTPPKDITEGEWEADGSDVLTDAKRIASTEMSRTTRLEEDANARMMAASKELAEALNEACEILTAVLREDINEPEDEIATPRDRFQALLIKSGYTP